MRQAKVNETQAYVISLTCHICGGDVWAAILAVLFELGFRPSMDGFLYLRRAIMLRYQNSDARISEIYQIIAQEYDSATSSAQVEQAIYSIITAAWQNRDAAQWDYFFSEKIMGRHSRPTNKEFISHMACFMELWCSYCRKEEVHGTK